MKKLFACLLVLIFCAFFNNTFAQADTLTILHVNDTHSNLAPSGPRTADLKGTKGGIARAATIIGYTRMTEPNVLLLHAGDAFIGDLFFNVYYGAAEFQLMNALGFDAMAVGNHEFDLEPSTLLGSLKASFEPEAGFPLLSANCILDDPQVDSLKNYISAYTIKEFGNMKVGIFGLTTPETNLLSLPSPAVIDPNIIDISANTIAELSSQQCDLIICLSHLGFILDETLASYVDGIDIIIGGHDHYKFEQPVAIQNSFGNTVYIVQAGAFYSHIGKMQIEVSNSGFSILNYTLIPLDETVTEEPPVAAQIDQLIAGIEQTYGPVYTQQIGGASAFFEEVADPLNNGFTDTPVGNLVCDAFRDKTETDIAIEPGGSTAQPIYEGPLVAADAFRTVGYGFNTVNGLGFRIATFNVLGSELKAGIEFGISALPLNDEFFIQVSGMSYDIDYNNPMEPKLANIFVDGVEIDTSATYSVTTNEFVLQALQLLLGIIPTNIFVYEDVTEFQVLSEYIASLGTITPNSGDRITDVESIEEKNVLAESYNLFQNYPNPFNPTTMISYSLPLSTSVLIEVYNSLGERVGQLVNREMSAGYHEIEFSAKGLPSGIYFYRIKTPEFVQVKKMLLLK